METWRENSEDVLSWTEDRPDNLLLLLLPLTSDGNSSSSATVDASNTKVTG